MTGQEAFEIAPTTYETAKSWRAWKRREPQLLHHLKLAPLDKKGRFMSSLPMVALAICTFGLLWLIPFLFSPRSYKVTSKGIVISTPFTSETIPVDKIKLVEIIGPVQHGALLSGNMNWGYAGLFALKDGSTAKVYATRWDRMVRVKTINLDPYLLSPAEPETFIEIVRNLILKK